MMLPFTDFIGVVFFFSEDVVGWIEMIRVPVLDLLLCFACVGDARLLLCPGQSA